MNEIQKPAIMPELFSRHLQALVKTLHVTDEKQARMPYDSILQKNLDEEINVMVSARANVDQELGEGHELIGQMKLYFRESVKPWFSQSFLMSRGLNKPNGHPGDYETLEAIYDNKPISSGIGEYLDRYFLNAPLAVAVRNRKDRMRNILLNFTNNGILSGGGG